MRRRGCVFRRRWESVWQSSSEEEKKRLERGAAGSADGSCDKKRGLREIRPESGE